MSNNNRQTQRNARFVTPVGIAVYPHLVKPDTKYNTSGVYVTELRLPADAMIKTDRGQDVATVQAFLDEQNEQAYKSKAESFVGKVDKKGKPVVITEADAPYRLDLETGEVIIKAKLNAFGKTKDGETFSQSPALFDAKGRPTSPESIWGGSKLKLSFEVIPYAIESTKTAGVSLRLKAVQIIELVSSSQGDGAGFGFGVEEGYETPEDEASSNGFTNEESTDDSNVATFDDDENGDF